MKIRILAMTVACAMLASLPLHSRSDDGHGGRDRGPGGGPDAHRFTPAPGARVVPRGGAGAGRVPFAFDDRYFHNHYYPARGYVMPAPPRGSISVLYGRDRYYFHTGVWLRPVGARFEVIVPPFGIVVPVLPVDVVTLWVAGMAYYYANGVYYRNEPGQGYVVVAPPAGVEQVQPVQQAASVPKAPPAPVIYPRNGQSSAQIEADRQECNRWAPTQQAAMADGEVFQRAFAACMDARGYSVR